MAAEESRSKSISDDNPQSKTKNESGGSGVNSESSGMVSYDDDDDDDDARSYPLITDKVRCPSEEPQKLDGQYLSHMMSKEK